MILVARLSVSSSSSSSIDIDLPHSKALRFRLAAPSHEISRHPTSVLRRQPHGCGPFGMIAAPMRFTRNSEIYGEDEAAEYLYQVVSGAVRTYKILEDGRRQIGAFYLPGDIFGFEARESHISSAEAICETHLLMVKRSAVIVRASHERELTRQLWDGMALELCLFQATFNAPDRQRRRSGDGLSARYVSPRYQERCDRTSHVTAGCCRLPWLTIETVSYAFTQLEQNGVIALPTSRRVELRDGRSSSRYAQNLG